MPAVDFLALLARLFYSFSMTAKTKTKAKSGKAEETTKNPYQRDNKMGIGGWFPAPKVRLWFWIAHHHDEMAPGTWMSWLLTEWAGDTLTRFPKDKEAQKQYDIYCEEAAKRKPRGHIKPKTEKTGYEERRGHLSFTGWGPVELLNLVDWLCVFRLNKTRTALLEEVIDRYCRILQIRYEDNPVWVAKFKTCEEEMKVWASTLQTRRGKQKLLERLK